MIQNHQVLKIREATFDEHKYIIAIMNNVLKEFGIENFEKEHHDDDGRRKAWVVVDSNQSNVIVGCVEIISLSETLCELRRMYLLPEYRGKGLGRQLINIALEYSKKAGFKRIELDTHSKMKDAIKLYQRNGFNEFCSKTRTCGCDRSMFLEL